MSTEKPGLLKKKAKFFPARFFNSLPSKMPETAGKFE
jgi:hypothetical protein